MDAMGVARNIVQDPRLVPGGGACEVAVSQGLASRAATLVGEGACKAIGSGLCHAEAIFEGRLCPTHSASHCTHIPPHGPCSTPCHTPGAPFASPPQEGVESWAYKAVGTAMEVIPRTLAQNCGANVIRTLTKLRAKVGSSLLHAQLCLRKLGWQRGRRSRSISLVLPPTPAHHQHLCSTRTRPAAALASTATPAR